MNVIYHTSLIHSVECDSQFCDSFVWSVTLLVRKVYHDAICVICKTGLKNWMIWKLQNCNKFTVVKLQSINLLRQWAPMKKPCCSIVTLATRITEVVCYRALSKNGQGCSRHEPMNSPATAWIASKDVWFKRREAYFHFPKTYKATFHNIAQLPSVISEKNWEPSSINPFRI